MMQKGIKNSKIRISWENVKKKYLLHKRTITIIFRI